MIVLVVEYWLRAAALRPLWYDELWRAHYLSVPRGQFWSELRNANTPSSAGWMAVTRVSADIFGWRPWALRLPELVTLPLLAAGTYGLTRRFTGPAAAVGAALLLTLSGTLLDLGTQLKPYTMEALCTVLTAALWLSAPAGHGRARSWVGRRTAAGLVSVFSVPAVFFLAPLASADVLMTRGGLRAKARAAVGALPALLICVVHSVLFIGRQSAQRGGTFWNTYFLANRGVVDAFRFIGHQLVAIGGSTPPGIDRSDVNVVHPASDGTFLEWWLIAPGFLLLFVLGSRVLLQRRDGRLLLAALAGSELLILAASAARYWPFGAVRTNTFLVPLLTLVPAVGIADLVRWARARRPLVVPAVALLAVSALAVGSALGTTVELWHRRHDQRLIDSYPLATDAVRRQARPGDLVVVTGRLARAGWIYSTGPRSDGPPGLPQPDTVFVNKGGNGTATAALRDRPAFSGRVLVFDLGIERVNERPELLELRRAGWCTEQARGFRGVGSLVVLATCANEESH